MRWPESAALSAVTEDAGFELRKRLAAYPEYLRQPGWVPTSGAAATEYAMGYKYIFGKRTSRAGI
jgi:hypothetical protein